MNLNRTVQVRDLVFICAKEYRNWEAAPSDYTRGRVMAALELASKIHFLAELQEYLGGVKLGETYHAHSNSL